HTHQLTTSSFTTTIRRHPTHTLFPYTTLFRSDTAASMLTALHAAKQELAAELEANLKQLKAVLEETQRMQKQMEAVLKEARAERSEEHTSELQSRENLVCRLLLEKKKEKTGHR